MSDRDPASSAPLSELVAMNIAGDIDHIVGTLEGASEVLLGPHGPTVQARQIGELCEELATRLRRIAAGIRDRGSRGAPHGNVGDGPFMSVPTPRDPQPEGEDDR